MLESVWCAAVRKTRNGVQLDSKERISVYEALRAVTINAACQSGEASTKGTLCRGKRADMIILEKNPLAVPKEQLCDIRILKTIKDGKCLFSVNP